MFRAGAAAALPIWLAFLPTSFALGLAARSYGLALGEILLMSALVYTGPAQFATLEALATGRPAAQVILTTLLINLRLAPMSATMAPYFRGAGWPRTLLGVQFLGVSSFVVPYARFERQGAPADMSPREGRENLNYYMGVAGTSFVVWLAGSGAGYLVAIGVSDSAREALRFLLPGYFASLMAVELKRGTARDVTVVSFAAAVPAAAVSADWGWLAVAVVVATAGFLKDRWTPGRS